MGDPDLAFEKCIYEVPIQFVVWVTFALYALIFLKRISAGSIKERHYSVGVANPYRVINKKTSDLSRLLSGSTLH